MKYIFSRHAQTEMERRNIFQVLVESVLNASQQIISQSGSVRTVNQLLT